MDLLYPRHLSILFIFILFIALIPFSANCQDLVKSRQSSYYTFIYKLNDHQATRLYDDTGDLDHSVLTTVYDFYPTDSSYDKKLPVGHYAIIFSDGQNLHCKVKSVNNLDVRTLNNSRDLMIVCYDSTGQEVKDAKVFIKRKKIPFDPDTKSYRLKVANKKGLLAASYQGHTSYFELSRSHNNGLLKRAGKKILDTFPVNHLLSPLVFLTNNLRGAINGGGPVPPGIYYRIRNLFGGIGFTGYVALNKPKYKPADTVRIKAFISRRNGKPFNKPVDVYLYGYSPGRSDKKIGSVDPYSRGAYKYTFVLHDSLKLSLDATYTLEFRKKRRYLLSKTFQYEEYELKQNSFSVRSENNTAGKPAILFLKGTDSNDMPLYDVRSQIMLKPKTINQYYQPHVFVGDTLWFHETKLSATGETKVVLPDSVLPDVSMDYVASVYFLNAENEKTEKTVNLTYDKKRLQVDMELKGDSLLISPAAPEMAGQQLTLEMHAAGRSISTKKILLPHGEKLNTLAENYSVHFRDQHKNLFLRHQSHNLEILGNRTDDSLTVVTDNPRKIRFRYFVFKNRRMIEQGESDGLRLSRPVDPTDHYTVSVQFVWGGESESNVYEFPFQTRNLNISLDHAPLVYPGQKANFKVTVTDALGHPVEDVDLTAYAITKKFPTASLASVPDFSKPPVTPVVVNSFEKAELSPEIIRVLSYGYWKKILGLDSIAIYKFLYPQSGYFENKTPAPVTQFAPFVVTNGRVLPVRVIYVDGEPVYFSGSDLIEPYSFAIQPGEHELQLRLNSALITIPRMKFEAGRKTIFSIDREKLPEGYTIVKMPTALKKTELSKLSRYFMLLEYNRAHRYIRQGNRFFLLKEYYYGGTGITGPFFPGKATYVEKNKDSISFDYEPFYRYEFRDNYLKLKEANTAKHLKQSPGWRFQPPSFKDQLQTLNDIEAYWKFIDVQRSRNFGRYPSMLRSEKPTGKLTLRTMSDLTELATFILNVDSPQEYYLVSDSITEEEFSPGRYQAVVIFLDGQYLKADSLLVRVNGINFYDLSKFDIRKADSLSEQLMSLVFEIPKGEDELKKKEDLQNVKMLYYQKFSAAGPFDHIVTGKVISAEDGSPLQGVNIVVKGSIVGTVTDMEGNYQINCTPDATLVFSFIGLETQEEYVGSRPLVNIKMRPDTRELREVIVTGFGVRQYSAPENRYALHGRVAGLRATGAIHRDVAIRGVGKFDSYGEPLVIIDGVFAKYGDVDPSMVTAMDILDAESAAAIYGSRAANGVILISTKRGATKQYLHEISTTAILSQEVVPGNTLRRNFREYAFWKPDLKTDVNGNAVFEAIFPDDITGWNAQVLGMGSKKRTGQTMSTIQSYKPLSAQISQPHFLIQGDHAVAIGKITNYGEDKKFVQRKITLNGQAPDTASFEIENSKIDTLNLKAAGVDSIAVKYTVSYKNYTDGELRKIPVYRRGVHEAHGTFMVLENDTTCTLERKQNGGVLKFYAQANLIDPLLDEITSLKNYPYECNEQLASRLRALLMEKVIRKHRNEAFTSEYQITKTLRKLTSNQGDDGGWGWWQKSDGMVWITLHAARALLQARKAGYHTGLDLEAAMDFLAGKLPYSDQRTRLEIFRFLLENGRRVEMKELADSIVQSKAPLYDRLLAQRLLQLSDAKTDWAWLKSVRSETVKGNYYWGEEKNDLSGNAVLSTILVYQMLEKEHPDNKDLIKIRNYFLEKRKENWRNTYESTLIVETLLPELLQKKSSNSKVRLQLSGSIDKTVDQFPFEFSTSDPLSLVISKSGAFPLYITAYEEKWNADPVNSDKDFVVITSFDHNPSNLVAGKTVKMKVSVEVKRDSEYVMVDVPIPAGCSYASKDQHRLNGEVHREYFYHKTTIFCQYLKKGVYEYMIELLPRYSGSYTINPASAACMYFPTLFGRENLKHVKIVSAK